MSASSSLNSLRGKRIVAVKQNTHYTFSCCGVTLYFDDGTSVHFYPHSQSSLTWDVGKDEFQKRPLPKLGKRVEYTYDLKKLVKAGITYNGPYVDLADGSTFIEYTIENEEQQRKLALLEGNDDHEFD